MTRPAILIAATLALSCGTADARECLNWREFRATEHKVRLRPHCWVATAAQRPISSRPRKEVGLGEPRPALETPQGDEHDDRVWPVLDPEPYPIGRAERLPDPEAVMPGWVPDGAFEAAPPLPNSLNSRATAAQAPQELARWPLFLGASMLALGGCAAWAWPRRRRDAILRDSLPMDPALMPRVTGAGVPRSATPHRPHPAGARSEEEA